MDSTKKSYYPHKLVAVITTLNEQATIYDLVHELKDNGVETVIVVDADSTDATVMQARSAGAVVIEWSRDPIADCLKIGWQRALQLGATRIVQIDAGGSHDPADIFYMMRAMDVSGSDVIVGSRFLPESKYHGRPLRAWGSRLVADLCSQRSRRNHTDWTSGYRLFTGRALQWLLTTQNRYHMHGWQIEVLYQALRMDLKVFDCAITYRAGRSSFSTSTAKEVWNAVHSIEPITGGWE